MRPFLLIIVIALIPLSACKPKEKPAPAKPPAVKYADPATFAGVYVFAGNAPPDPPCTVSLQNDAIAAAPDTHTATAGPGCTVQYPVLVTLGGWEVVGGADIRLLDPDGYALGDFNRDAAGLLHGKGEDDAKPYTMTPMAMWMKAQTSPAAP